VQKRLLKLQKMGKMPADLTRGNDEGNPAVIAKADTESNSSKRDTEVPQPAAPRRISRARQLKALDPIPDPLRNRGKKRMKQYVFIGVAVALAVVALILAGRSLNLPGLSFLRF
jgi:hypothetical protein